MSLPLEEVRALTQPVFDAIPGYRLSHRARERERRTESSFVYGETLLEPFFELVSGLGLAPGATFLDLGSGAGLAVAYAALLFDFKEVRGYELLPDLHDAAVAALAQLSAQLPSGAPDLGPGRVRLAQASLLEADFATADVVYVMTAVFEESLLAALSSRVARLKPGAWFLAVGTALESPHLLQIRWGPFETGWGASQVYVYRAVAGAP